MGCPKLTYHQETELRIIHRRKELTINKSDLKGGNNLVFGMLMPGRQYNSSDYAFGFQGQEVDNEIKGVGNSLDFGARIYDSRLGRWLSLDPLAEKYPSLSPYSMVDNSPIKNLEVDGRYWIESTTCNKGTCPVGGQGHNGYHKITNYKVIVQESYHLTDLTHQIQAIPYLGLLGAASKGMIAAKDNSVSWGFTDLISIALDFIGMRAAKNADGLGSVLIQANRTGVAMGMREFSKTEAFEILLDNMTIQMLEKQGYGEATESSFEFSQEFLDEMHQSVSKDFKERIEAGEKPTFGGVDISSSSAVAREMEKRLKSIVDETKETAREMMEETINVIENESINEEE